MLLGRVYAHKRAEYDGVTIEALKNANAPFHAAVNRGRLEREKTKKRQFSTIDTAVFKEANTTKILSFYNLSMLRRFASQKESIYF